MAVPRMSGLPERGVLSGDSSPAIERLQIDAWRRTSSLDKARAVDALTRMAQGLALAGIRRRHPGASEKFTCTPTPRNCCVLTTERGHRTVPGRAAGGGGPRTVRRARGHSAAEAAVVSPGRGGVGPSVARHPRNRAGTGAPSGRAITSGRRAPAGRHGSARPRAPGEVLSGMGRRLPSRPDVAGLSDEAQQPRGGPDPLPPTEDPPFGGRQDRPSRSRVTSLLPQCNCGSRFDCG